jgi:hypothetical protein
MRAGFEQSIQKFMNTGIITSKFIWITNADFVAQAQKNF